MGFRNARLKAGKEVKEVAEYMKVSVVTVYFWERGTYFPRRDKLIRLAKFYGCSVDELLKDDDCDDNDILCENQSH